MEAVEFRRRLGFHPCLLEHAWSEGSTLLACEDEGIGPEADKAAEMGLDLRDDAGRNGHEATAGLALWRPDEQPSIAELLHGALDADCAVEQVDLGALQRHQLPRQKPAPCGEEDEEAQPRRDGVGQGTSPRRWSRRDAQERCRHRVDGIWAPVG